MIELLRWLGSLLYNMGESIFDTIHMLERKKREEDYKRSIENAQRILQNHGFTLDAEWLDLTYRGDRYHPVMIEQDMMNEEDVIIITAQKVN